MAQSGYTPILIYASGTATNIPAAGDLTSGSSGAELAINYADGKLYYKDSSGNVQLIASKAGASGDVVGPSSATDNAIVRFDGTTGKLVQNSVVTIADSTGDISGVGTLNATTLDATNIEVTNIKAKDGTAAASIADSTGVISVTANPILSGGSANGVLYLNGSKVATSGSALTFDGTNLGVGTANPASLTGGASTGVAFNGSSSVELDFATAGVRRGYFYADSNAAEVGTVTGSIPIKFAIGLSETMRLTSTGLGIGTSSPSQRLAVIDNTTYQARAATATGNYTSGGMVFGGFGADASDPNYYGAVGYDHSTGKTYIKNKQFNATGGIVLQVAASGGFSDAVLLDSSGNLGIGTSSPVGRLTIQGAAGTSGINQGIGLLYSNGTQYGALGLNNSTGWPQLMARAGAGLTFHVNSDLVTTGEVMRLDTSGNLGLGVTPSAWNTFSAAQVGAGAAVFGHQSTVSEAYLSANLYYNSGVKYIGSGPATYYGQSSGTHAWYTAPSGTAGNAITFTQSMTLDASGNLGLGETSPYSLSNYGAMTIRGSVGGLTMYRAGATNIGYVGGNNSDELFIANLRSSGYITLSTNAAERARITSGGDLLVGTTSTAAKLTVEQSGFNANGASITNQSYNYQTLGLHNTATANDNLWVTFGTEASFTLRGSIDYNRAGGLTRYNTTSDYRAKDIIGPVQNTGAIIDALKVYEGKMKGATQARPMMVAHEAQAVVPFCVSGVKDETNEDGTPKYQQMDVSSLVPLLLAEIQSLRQRVALLEGN